MTDITITFSDRSTLPDQLETKANELGITTEQLAKRLIAAGMSQYEPKGAATPGETLEDFLVKNGAYTS